MKEPLKPKTMGRELKVSELKPTTLVVIEGGHPSSAIFSKSLPQPGGSEAWPREWWVLEVSSVSATFGARRFWAKLIALRTPPDFEQITDHADRALKIYEHLGVDIDPALGQPIVFPPNTENLS